MVAGEQHQGLGISGPQADEISRRLPEWGRQHFRRFPWRKALPLWKGLLVEVMLQRTRANQVVPAFRALDSQYPNARSLQDISRNDVTSLLRPLGLAWRIPLFLQLAREIARRRGRLPRRCTLLATLPGVGQYTAAAALSLHGNIRAVLVDSNTVRVASRLVGREFDGETRRKPWIREALEALTPADRHRDFNYAMLDLAALICTVRRPACNCCPIKNQCATGSESGSVLLL